MLESMRNHAQGWIAKVILTGIALSFVLWGVGDYFTGGNAEPVATINEKPIDGSEFYVAYERQLNAYRSMLGKQYSRELLDSLNVKETTLQTMINRKIMLDVAAKLGLAAPESVVLATVQTDPAFQSAGQFDPKRYQILTRNMGFGSSQDYENDVRMTIMIDALEKSLIQSSYVSEAEIRDLFNQKFEQRVLSSIVVDAASLLSKVEVDDATAKAWYEANKASYQSPLRVQVNTVEINPRTLAADAVINETDLLAEYEKRKAEFSEPEQRKARHILVRVNESDSEMLRVAAREKIEAAQARIKAGEDFSAIAKEISADPATAVKGGELGWFKQGMMVAAFDAAVFSMDKGTTSDIVETEFGYHLIRIDDIRPARVTPFEDVKGKIKDELLLAKGAEEAYKLSQDLDEALGMEDSLKAAAEAVDLKMLSSKAVSMDEAIVEPGLSDQQIRQKAFATLPGQAVEIIETDDGRFIAIEVVQRIDPDVLPFAKVTRQVYSDAKQDAANKKAFEVAEEIRKQSGKSLDELAQQFGQAKFISKPVRSTGVGDDAAWLTSAVLGNGFKAAQGSWVDQSIAVPQGFAVVHVDQVIAPSEDDYNTQKEAITKEAVKAKGQVRFARWLSSVREGYEVTTNEKALSLF
ncbi:peptidyl-prolyl cis-trans isomerase D [Mariprofundus micogutta]|uniref:Periplasmic chaperone PpiD n=1 Tax=Mariprofundus micogutta TaxID=1921010 RepID=A0A1L8CPG8_9PROT|nr:SurA N-terminal domain-containing protein [Mariprofundus micogutta]GAV20797.1 peptidyl-prolyl cis-trans isomerase D [Mariprofundus micogutta]